MKKMNMEEAVRTRGTTEVGTRFINSSGKPFAEFASGDSFSAEFEILRADLAGLFMESVESLDNVQFKYGDYIKSLEQTPKNINVTFAGGSNETFDLVVGADGTTSTTRPMILDEPILKDGFNFIGQYIAFFTIPSQPTDGKFWLCYNAPKGLSVMIRPHRNTSTMGAYLCITTPKHGVQDPVVEKAMDQGTEETKKMLREYFKDAGWEAMRVLDGMDQADDFYMSRATQVILPKWTNSRALVIGDAAFATFGVGTTLAIESAYVLAGELSKIQSSEEVLQAVERYEEVFRPLYKKMEVLPRGFPQVAFPQTKWALGLRDSVLWGVSKTGLYKLFQGGEGQKWNLPEYEWADVPEMSKSVSI
jgi:2-polyprenyl-6-methoxyphenol hydroxylase-like FAD-dependent oxidoreductase